MSLRSWSALFPSVLEKDRNLRYQHASEIRTDLQRLKRDTDSGRSAAVHEPRQDLAAALP